MSAHDFQKPVFFLKQYDHFLRSLKYSQTFWDANHIRETNYKDMACKAK